MRAAAQRRAETDRNGAFPPESCFLLARNQLCTILLAIVLCTDARERANLQGKLDLWSGMPTTVTYAVDKTAPDAPRPLAQAVIGTGSGAISEFHLSRRTLLQRRAHRHAEDGDACRIYAALLPGDRSQREDLTASDLRYHRQITRVGTTPSGQLAVGRAASRLVA